MHNPTGTEVSASEVTQPTHAHPRSGEYVRIAVILAVITLCEVLVYYQESLHAVLVPILLVLSAIKFSLVALFFMHLKFDNRLFSTIFAGPLVLAFAVLVALLTIFHRVLFGV
ncbi:MAG TPA: cytochrome C oxidase subunit IV family protein [Chloroflexota bacterium]|nr:cytochrome C oxidase subunit IV family protein [Chloroflexota bacterium]